MRWAALCNYLTARCWPKCASSYNRITITYPRSSRRSSRASNSAKFADAMQRPIEARDFSCPAREDLRLRRDLPQALQLSSGQVRVDPGEEKVGPVFTQLGPEASGLAPRYGV